MTQPEFQVNDDGSVSQELMVQHYAKAWEPDYVTVGQIREILGEDTSGGNSSALMSQVMSIVKQMKPGTVMTDFKNPMSFQNPKSTLDMYADIASPTEEFLTLYKERDPCQRMLKIFQQFLRSLTTAQIKGMGQSTPYNPILRERFMCKWEHETSTTHHLSEQVSHHPPITSAITWNEKAHFMYWSTTSMLPVFRGNSVELKSKGDQRFAIFVQDPETEQFAREEYQISLPHFSFSGLLIGVSKMGISTQSFEMSCKETGLKMKIKFKSGGSFKGKIYKTEKKVQRLKGVLDGECLVIDLEKNPGSKDWAAHGTVFIDTSKWLATMKMKTVAPVEEMHPLESRRVWFASNYAIRGLKDLEIAGKYKSLVEEHQRDLRKRADFTTEPELFMRKNKKLQVYTYKKFDDIERLCSGEGNDPLGDDDDDNDDLD